MFFLAVALLVSNRTSAMQSNGEKTVRARRRRRRWSEWSAPPPVLNPVFSNNSPVPHLVQFHTAAASIPWHLFAGSRASFAGFGVSIGGASVSGSQL